MFSKNSNYALICSKYGLETLFYETVRDEDKYTTVAVVRSDSNLKTFKDLLGKKACFPLYKGIGWNSVISKIKNELSSCNYEKAMSEYFGESCVPNIPFRYKTTLGKLCDKEYQGDFGSLDCFVNNKADVAFVSKNNLGKYFSEYSL